MDVFAHALTERYRKNRENTCEPAAQLAGSSRKIFTSSIARATLALRPITETPRPAQSLFFQHQRSRGHSDLLPSLDSESGVAGLRQRKNQHSSATDCFKPTAAIVRGLILAALGMGHSAELHSPKACYTLQQKPRSMCDALQDRRAPQRRIQLLKSFHNAKCRWLAANSTSAEEGAESRDPRSLGLSPRYRATPSPRFLRFRVSCPRSVAVPPVQPNS